MHVLIVGVGPPVFRTLNKSQSYFCIQPLKRNPITDYKLQLLPERWLSVQMFRHLISYPTKTASNLTRQTSDLNI